MENPSCAKAATIPSPYLCHLLLQTEGKTCSGSDASDTNNSKVDITSAPSASDAVATLSEGNDIDGGTVY